MLASLLNTIPGDLDYEIILIDDGSTDGTREWLSGINNQNISVIFNENNLGYARSNNKAINVAQGNILGLLNNDLILLDGWLEPMLQALYNSHLATGIVGNIQHRVIDHAIDHTGINVSHLATLHHIHESPNNDEIFTRRFAITGACCLLFKQDFLAVGGFDEQYINGGEDVDLCLKLSAMLNKHAYTANSSNVMHHVSLSRDPDSSNNEKNSQRLFSKWHPVILQEVKNAWMKILSSPNDEDLKILSQFNLNKSCHKTPHAISLMLAKSIMGRQEAWWKQLIDGEYLELINPIEKVDGFYCDTIHPFACILNKAWLTVTKGVICRNISISGEIIPLNNLDQSLFNELVINIAINGIQASCLTKLSIGQFNLRIDNPVFSKNCPSVISISIDFKSTRSIPESFLRSIRFVSVSMDEYKVLELSGKLSTSTPVN